VVQLDKASAPTLAKCPPIEGLGGCEPGNEWSNQILRRSCPANLSLKPSVTHERRNPGMEESWADAKILPFAAVPSKWIDFHYGEALMAQVADTITRVSCGA
jgi:hypothetical protein